MNPRDIEQALDEYLGAVLSSRRTAEGPARGLAALSDKQVKFALHWTEVISKSNSEMAYQFVAHAPRALAALGVEGARRWLLRALDIYDREGLYPGSAAFRDIDAFARDYRLKEVAVEFGDVQAVLERFIRGLAGRELKIAAASDGRPRTDTETLFLPPAVHRFDNREQNYQLYKATATLLWAQTRFGTFRRETPDAPHLADKIAELGATVGDHGRALRLFNLLETIRLTACIERELPGLFRDMQALDSASAAAPAHDATWRHFIARLQDAAASVADTLAATAALYPLQSRWPRALLYQGELDPAAAQTVIDARVETERAQLQRILGEMLAAARAEAADDDVARRFSMRDDGDGDGELLMDGEAADLPPEASALLESLLQDLQELPEDWLQPAGDGEYRPADGDGDGDAPAGQPGSATDAIYYDEWDFRRRSYRKNWCALRELPAHPLHDDFAAATVEKYRPQVADIRRHFEALRDQDKLLKAQSAGDDIDLDALVTARADAAAGAEMTSRVFTRKHKTERDLAVVFMVDVSGSTKGWINQAERESLILLCEALEILRDQYAIYAFSGMTRNRCEIYTVKTFAQAFDADTRARISGLRPQDYTRMGVVIRHLSAALARIESRTRVLITLSDGKPDDYDGYRGDYGIEDTRQALLEARHAGIHPFCITIDTEAGDYLPHMYGHANYVVVDEVRKLPLKVADIYRKLTT